MRVREVDDPLRVLITGVNGFVGKHLARFCVEQGVEVYGTHRRASGRPDPELPSEVVLIEMELTDPDGVTEAIEKAAPDRVFHLAGWSYPRGSIEAAAETFAANVMGQLNVLEALRSLGMTTVKILLVGSCEEYGIVEPDELPITEGNPLRPVTPYGVSKVAQDLMGAQYCKTHGLDIVRVRSFHLAGPLSSELYVLSSFAKQIAEIEAGLRDPELRVGNLDAVRDFTDVRDAVRGFWLCLESGEPGAVYNLGSGRPIAIKKIVAILLEHARVPIKTAVDQARLRGDDALALVCDATKLRERTGWQPTLEIATTVVDTLEYWRRRVAAASQS